MSKAIIFFADGLEECEALITVDLLRRAGVEVTIASVMGRAEIVGAHKIRILCDAVAESVDLSAADAVILPGGLPGTEHLYESALVRGAVQSFAEAGKLVAAICAAPTVPGRMGLLKGKRATCYPGCEGDLEGADYADTETVTDGNFVTGSSLGAAIPFALAVIAWLDGQEKSDEVRKSIVYRH